MHRVYYSTKEGLIDFYLEIAEKRILEIEEHGTPTDLVGIIELWHIYRLFDDDCSLERWNKEYFNKLKSKCVSYNKEVAIYFKHLGSDYIEQEYNTLEFGYKESFWKIVSQFKCFHIITSNFLTSTLKDGNNLRFVLSNKTLVEKFNVILHKVLLTNKNTAHILLDKYVCLDSNSGETQLYIPKNFTEQDTEKVISDYLDSDDVNLNYVRLICQSKNVDGFKLSPRVRYKAKKLESKLNDDIINDPDAIITESKVSIKFSDAEGIPIVSYSLENGIPSYTYSLNYIKESTNNQKIFFVANHFKWFNNHGLINLINKDNEVDVFERFFANRGKYSYSDFISFQYKNNLSVFQLRKYCNTLKELGFSFENELKVFYEQNLKNEFGYPALKIELPCIEDNWLIKCRNIFPELDNISKQYYTYVSEDEIDYEYMSCLKPMKLEAIKSFLKCKYINAPAGKNEVYTIMHYLFKSAFLCYVGPFRNKKYRSLTELLDNEIVYYSYYEKNIKQYIDFLIDKEILLVNEDGVLKYTNIYKIEILKYLWEFNSCSYWHLDENAREVADEMIKKGWAVADDHLLSKEEIDYFSFYTDNEKFTNGYSYRNHYAHSSNPPTDDVNYHITAYLVLLKLLTMLVIKIYDDLWLARKVMTIDLRNKCINNTENENNNYK